MNRTAGLFVVNALEVLCVVAFVVFVLVMAGLVS